MTGTANDQRYTDVGSGVNSTNMNFGVSNRNSSFHTVSLNTDVEAWSAVVTRQLSMAVSCR